METGIRGLSTVRVAKEYLLEKLKVNREEHKRLYEEAMEGWHIKVISALEEHLEKAKADTLYSPNWYMPKPDGHVKDYDRTIALLVASLDEEFELTAAEFDQYVMDNWSWKGNFMTTISGCGYIDIK